MRTSLKWIKDLVPGIEDLTPQEYLDAMTLSGSKGEYYVELDKNLENIVIGQILKIEKHPDADKLVICQVNVGQEEPVQIVTGVHQTFLKALLFRLSLQAEKLPAVMTAAPLRKRASRSKRANSAVYQVTV